MKISTILSALILVPVIGIGFLAIFNFIAAIIVMELWNCFCGCFHLGPMTYWQTWCFLTFLCFIATIFHSKSSNQN